MIGQRKLLGNSLSLLANRLTQSVTSFVLFAFIARLLGAYELGQYTLAFSYYFVFMTLAAAGLKTLFTRELSRNSQETPLYLVNGTLLQLIFSLIGYVAMVATIFVLPYNSSTSTICYIMGSMIVPFSLSNITEAIFQAYEKMHLIAFSTVPIYILRLLVMIWAMNLHYGVNWLAAIGAISEMLILFIEWALILPFVKPKWQLDWDFMRRTVKAAWVFLSIEGMAVVKDRMQILILSILGGEEVVGIYGAVTQLMQPFQIISFSLVIAVFPKMSKAVTLGREKQRQLSESIVEMLLIAALPLVVAIFFIGQDLLTLIYQNSSFIKANVALIILALGLIASSFSRPLSYTLVANGFEKINLYEVLITSVIGGFLSVFMIEKYQLNGAAISSLIMQIIAFAVYIYSVYKNLFSLHVWKIVSRPILISILMLLVFLCIQKFKLDIFMTMLTASLAYVLIVGSFMIHKMGFSNILSEKVFSKKRL